MIEADSGGNLLDKITHLVNHLLSGSAPNSLAPFIAGANLFGLPKKDKGIRPVAVAEIIGVSDTIQICSNLCHSSQANNTTGNFQLLGSPIGSTDFIKDVLLRDYLPILTKEIKVIANLPDPQSAYLLLRHCASAHIIGHLTRTISPLTLRASQLTVSAKIQASLPFRLGGSGFRNTTIHSSNAFVKSVRAVSEISSREPICRPLEKSFDVSFINAPAFALTCQFAGFGRGEDARGVGNALPSTGLTVETGRYPSLWDPPEPQRSELDSTSLRRRRQMSRHPVSNSSYKDIRGSVDSLNARKCASNFSFIEKQQSSSSYSRDRVPSRLTYAHRERRPVISSNKYGTTKPYVNNDNKGSFDFTESLKMTCTKMRETDSEEEYCESFKILDKDENGIT
ncbi:hypothetical protein GJ496_011426 [Pomphorhynchus laevis]|nr:hypothetical protein GJ496_011426 [Pomphorhynchus laevis]